MTGVDIAVAARDVLLSADARGKAVAGRAVAAAWRNGDLAMPRPVDLPDRPARSTGRWATSTSSAIRITGRIPTTAG